MYANVVKKWGKQLRKKNMLIHSRVTLMSLASTSTELAVPPDKILFDFPLEFLSQVSTLYSTPHPVRHAFNLSRSIRLFLCSIFYGFIRSVFASACPSSTFIFDNIMFCLLFHSQLMIGMFSHKALHFCSNKFDIWIYCFICRWV